MRLSLFLPVLTLSFVFTTMAYTDEQTVLKDDSFSPQIHSKPSLADWLTIEKPVSIFYTYARDLELSSLFTDERARLTLFAPTNKAVMALARKPHQGPSTPDDGAYVSDQEYDRISKENVRQWISSHIIPESPIDLDSTESKPTLLGGKSITFRPISKNDGQCPTWSRVTLEDGIKILRMREASNGVLYVIDGTVVA
ncbi:hypothetical protein AX15_000463 [Amanita polypyramis BW_CC]|nr:hypothetical protein AX15_000463 [Amanita polypyramis BW_CC]